MNLPPKTRVRYQPHLALRLACWFAIYLANSYLVFIGASVKAGATFWPYYPTSFPTGLSYFIVGILGLSPDLKYGYFATVLAYGFYLLHLVLSLSFRSQKIFWSLLLIFLVIAFITGCGHGSYDGPVFEEIPTPQSPPAIP